MRIEGRELEAGYGSSRVLKGVSLGVSSGEFVGLVGPNGSGKSTLLRVLSGALRPRHGGVAIDGRPVHGMSPRHLAGCLAFVPQAESTLFEFAVREVVMMGRYAHVRSRSGETAEDYAAVSRALASADILHLAERPITGLSGGEHRRVLIARALAQEAPILLLDEPTAHLDLTHQTDLLMILRRKAASDGCCVMAALHDLNLAGELCDRLILLGSGTVVADGPPREVLTAELLRHAYGAELTVGRNPGSGAPLVLPPSMEAIDGAHSGRHVHVVCGGGTGVYVMSRLHRLGYSVTCGVLNQLDSDEEAASAMGLPVALEAPFSPVGESAAAEASVMMSAADAVVVTGIPMGRGNLPNLRLALDAACAGTPVYLLAETPPETRDFCGGEGLRLWHDIVQAGGVSMPDIDGVADVLRGARGATLNAHEGAS